MASSATPSRPGTRISVNSEPERILSVLAFRSPEDRNEWGDDLADLRVALRTVEKLATAQNATWRKLVAAGLTEKLCLGFSEYTRPMVDYESSQPQRPRPDGEADDLLNFIFDEQPPFYKPLCALFEGLGGRPNGGALDGTRRRMLQVIRKHWSKIMQRIWLERDQSAPRTMLSSLVLKLLSLDPLFVNFTDDHQDLTLPLIVHSWRHEESDMENFSNIQALSLYLEALRILPSFADGSLASSRTPFDSNSGDYEGRPDDAHRILGRLFQGLGTASFEDMRRLIDELCQCKISPQYERHIFMHLAYLVTSAENQPDIAQSENFRNLQRAVVPTEMFWRMQFESIRQAGNETNEAKELLLLGFVTLLRDVGPSYNLESEEDTQALVFAWVKAGIFGLLELVATIIVPAAGNRASLHALSAFSDVFQALNRVLRTNPSTALSVLRPHLPRPRLLRSLLDWDLGRQEGNRTHSAGELIMLPDCDGSDPQDYDHSLHMLWLTVFLLQSRRNLRSECARRECDKEGKSFCGACRRVKYCGPQCQRLDWKEHKVVCGLRVFMDGELGIVDGRLGWTADSDSWPLLEGKCGWIRFFYPGKTPADHPAKVTA